MDLNTLWFVLITVLFTGFFFLEGFDYGVGMLLPFLGKNDAERRVIINTIGPVWDGNEVWMLTAGGAIFAAFPHVYATLFSGFYLALVLMLLALILRGVSFEFRSKDESPSWRNRWDWSIFFGSAVPALLWGVASANLLHGVPIDADKDYVGTFFTLLNPYGLIGGVLFVVLFLLHGAVFLSLKTDGDIRVRARGVAMKVWGIALVVYLVFVGATLTMTDFYANRGIVGVVLAVIALAALVMVRPFLAKASEGKAFVAMAANIVFTVVTLFAGLFPRLMVSSLDPGWSLTIYNASSSQYTLKVMTIVALLLVPIVLVYQGWTYWTFRQRLTVESELEY